MFYHGCSKNRVLQKLSASPSLFFSASHLHPRSQDPGFSPPPSTVFLLLLLFPLRRLTPSLAASAIGTKRENEGSRRLPNRPPPPHLLLPSRPPSSIASPFDLPPRLRSVLRRLRDPEPSPEPPPAPPLLFNRRQI